MAGQPETDPAAYSSHLCIVIAGGEENKRRAAERMTASNHNVAPLRMTGPASKLGRQILTANLRRVHNSQSEPSLQLPFCWQKFSPLRKNCGTFSLAASLLTTASVFFSSPPFHGKLLAKAIPSFCAPLSSSLQMPFNQGSH